MTPEQKKAWREYMDGIIPHREMDRGPAYKNLPQMLLCNDPVYLRADNPLTEPLNYFMHRYMGNLQCGEHAAAEKQRKDLVTIVYSILEALAYQEACQIKVTGGLSYFENTSQPLKL